MGASFDVDHPSTTNMEVTVDDQKNGMNDINFMTETPETDVENGTLKKQNGDEVKNNEQNEELKIIVDLSQTKQNKNAVEFRGTDVKSMWNELHCELDYILNNGSHDWKNRYSLHLRSNNVLIKQVKDFEQMLIAGGCVDLFLKVVFLFVFLSFHFSIISALLKFFLFCFCFFWVYVYGISHIT